jgi:hypothetical protein
MAELFPVNELRSSYGIGKQADINRRKHLGIKPIKVEGNYYVTKEQLDRLDALHQYLQQNPGAKMSSHFSLDMHVLKGPDCPANEPAVGERALGPRASPAEGTTTARAPPSWQNSVP